jgi:hypothetical protein
MHVLQLLSLVAADGRAPAGVVGGVERGPEGGRELVDEVPMQGVDGVLLEGLSIEEVVIVRERT